MDWRLRSLNYSIKLKWNKSLTTLKSSRSKIDFDITKVQNLSYKEGLCMKKDIPHLKDDKAFLVNDL